MLLLRFVINNSGLGSAELAKSEVSAYCVTPLRRFPAIRRKSGSSAITSPTFYASLSVMAFRAIFWRAKISLALKFSRALRANRAASDAPRGFAIGFAYALR